MLGTAQLTDEVVGAAVGGSRRDLDRIVLVLEPQVRLMVAARLSPSPRQLDVVDDLVQQVLMGLTVGISRLRHRSVIGLKAYLSGIVRREVAMLLRRGGRQTRVSGRVRSLYSRVAARSRDAPLWQMLSGSVTSPGSAMDRAEQTERVLCELGGLKREHRRVIILAFFDQLPVREIAREIHVSPGAASMLLVRAVRALRQRLGTVAGEEQPHGTLA